MPEGHRRSDYELIFILVIIFTIISKFFKLLYKFFFGPKLDLGGAVSVELLSFFPFGAGVARCRLSPIVDTADARLAISCGDVRSARLHMKYAAATRLLAGAQYAE